MVYFKVMYKNLAYRGSSSDSWETAVVGPGF